MQTISKILPKISKGTPFLFSILMFAHLLMVLTYYIYAITESRIKKDLPSPINLQLNNYSIEHTPSKLSTGGW